MRRSDGTLIAGAVLTLERSDLAIGPIEEVLFGSRPVPAISDAGGRFRLCWLPSGEYRIAVQHPTSLAMRTEPIDVPPDGAVEGVTIVLAPAAAVRVTARSADAGTPLREREIRLLKAGGETAARATTGRDGVATFASLAAGEYVVATVASAARPVRASLGAITDVLLEE